MENYYDWLWFLQNVKKVVGDKKVVIIFDRHLCLLRSVSKILGSKNHAYCYRHLKENFSSFLNKQNTKGCKRKENALEWLDKIAYVGLDTDYNAHMFELRKYNESLATWIKQYEPEHWAMSKLPTHRWDKMTTNLVQSFNAWLRNERYHSICSFIVEHITKLGAILI